MNAKIFGAVTALVLGLATAAAADTTLVMVEQDGCVYCARWHAEVGDIYPLTEFADTAPLRLVDLHDLPDDVTFASRLVFTPTFVMVEDGQEIARAEGYVGDELFWMHMELLFRQLEEHRAEAPTQ